MRAHYYAQLESVSEFVVVALSGEIFHVAAAGVTAFATIGVEVMKDVVPVIAGAGIAPHVHELPYYLITVSAPDHH